MRFHYRHYRIPGPPVHHPGQFTARVRRAYSDIRKLLDAVSSPYFRPKEGGPKVFKIGNAVFTSKPLSRGGKTECVVLDDDGDVISTGVAWCSPKDAYNAKIGRAIARGRAVRDLEERGPHSVQEAL